MAFQQIRTTFRVLFGIFIILVWGLFGLPFHFNNTWQLIISTLAAIISVLMLFIIQNSQNRHTIAIQLKLDEIIRATKGAHNEMMDIEKLTVVFLTRYKQNLRFENENPKIEERINSIQSVGKGKLEPIEPTLKYHRKTESRFSFWTV